MKKIDAKDVTILALSIVVIVQFFLNNNRVDRLARQFTIQKTMAEFKAPYDSAYSKNDTISFFKDDTLVGTTITTVRLDE
jgi:hypothetical protein